MVDLGKELIREIILTTTLVAIFSMSVGVLFIRSLVRFIEVNFNFTPYEKRETKP